MISLSATPWARQGSISRQGVHGCSTHKPYRDPVSECNRYLLFGNGLLNLSY